MRLYKFLRYLVARTIYPINYRLHYWAEKVFFDRTPQPGMPLRPCAVCHTMTTTRITVIEPKTLRRRRSPRCLDCGETPAEKEARTLRSGKDWQQMSTPILQTMIEDRMGEQYPSHVREALRAFAATNLERATVPHVSSSTLQSAIQTLGLNHEMYAEQRGEEATLRRTRKPQKDKTT